MIGDSFSERNFELAPSKDKTPSRIVVPVK